jgi:hypothetical protein
VVPATGPAATVCFAHHRPIAGQQYDPHYHQACDTFSNNSNEVLDLNSDAIAFGALTYAMNTSSVNGAAAA